MKILNIMLGTKKGGLEQVFVDYINAQLIGKHEVYGVCMKKCPYVKQVEELDVKLEKLTSRSIYNPLSVYKIFKIIKKINPDLIVLCGNRPVKMTISNPFKFLFKTKKPVLSIINNNHSYVKDVKYAVSVSTDIQAKVKSEGVEHSFYAPNTTKTEPFKAYDETKKPVVGVIGRLHKNKGFDVFLESVKILKDQGFDFKIVIAGDGPEKETLDQKAKDLGLFDDIEFMGWIDDKNKFYDKIDIFCLSSRVEPFGIVLLEAMTRTKAIVSTDCQGPLDVFENSTDGIVVEKENPQALALGLQKLLENPSLAKTLAENGYKKSVDEYSPERLSERLDEVFKQILQLKERNKE